MSDFELSRLLLSLLLLLSASLVLGQIFEALGLPRVVGEIVSGLILGPSLLGTFAPEVYQAIFLAFDDQAKLLTVFYWLGLILLMFSAGFQINTALAVGDRKTVLMLVVGAIGMPFLLGFAYSPLVPGLAVGGDKLAFAMVIACAAAVTSIPVLTKIYVDLGMMETRFARVTLTAATLQDLVLWIAFSLALAVQQGRLIDASGLVSVVAATVFFTIFVIVAVPGMIRFAARPLVAKATDGVLLGYAMLVCLAIVSVASVFHVNVVFGALLSGLVLSAYTTPRLHEVKRAISQVSMWFFVPIYFSLVGLKIDILEDLDLGLLLAFLAATSSVKILSVVLIMRSALESWRRPIDYGIVLNARGGPGIVLASVAHEAGIVDKKLFVVLVLTSLLTSLMAGVWLQRRLHSDVKYFG